MEKALRESDRKRARLETFLSAEARGQDLELLHLRHVQGRTVAQVQAALAEQGVYYGQRHVERLLSAAERRVFPQWEAWEREEKLRERAHRTNEPG